MIAFQGTYDMFSFLSQVAGFFASAPAEAKAHGVAHQLMERAEACAGRNPQDAQQLRQAASAYLSVVR